MVGSISFGGLASGLDTGAIIQALLEAERVPITILEGRKAEVQDKISFLGTFRGLVGDLKDRAESLGTSDGFLNYAANVSVDGIADVSASSGVTPGSHTLTAFFLATSDRWAFDAVADPDADLGTADGQSVSFDYDGTSYSIAVDVVDSSLNEVAAAINQQAGTAVSAFVVNTGTASSPSYELVLAGRETGEDFRIENLTSTITGLTVDGTGPDAGGNPQSANNLTVANNAVAEVDGLIVERSTNDFSDVVPGLSITLLAADPATELTISVEPDKDAIKGGIQDFVDAYNAVVQFINEQSSYDEDEGAGGPLFGDSLLRTVQNTLSSALFNQSAADAQADTAGYGTLRLLGLEKQNDGTLTINSAVLDSKLDGDLDAFADLFVDTDGFDNLGAVPGDPTYYVDGTADTGLADDLARALERLLEESLGTGNEAFEGVFDVRLQALNDSIETMDERIEQHEFRLERFEAHLVARFSALESLLGQLNAQQAFLDQNLS